MTDAADIPSPSEPLAEETGDGVAEPLAEVVDEVVAEPDTVASRLLVLQRIDTEADQLSVRRERLAERDDLATSAANMAEWTRRRTEMTARLQELSDLIESEEKVGAELTTHRQRLEAQLKTVIAPREAEALMHEIDTINGQRDELDDKELAALEEQSAIDDELTAHLAREEALRASLSSAENALAIVCADIDAELENLAARRSEAMAELEAPVLARYDSVRSSMGVAVANLKGHRCEGCHLDLSAAEVDTAKDEAAESGYTDCPQCGRMLVV